MPDSPPEVPVYQPQDWLDDFQSVLSLQGKLKDSGAHFFPPEEMTAYFQTKYGSLATFHEKRIKAALSYIDQNFKALDKPGVAVVGEKEGGITSALAKALFTVFSRCPDANLEDPFPLDYVLQLAEEYAKKS